MIRSIFYARFHAERGPKILHEVPEGSITPSDSHSALRQPLFDYTSILDCIIPRQEFCDRLVTICVSRYRIIGFPVCISDYDGKYDRNEFIFNFALVIDEDLEDWASYASVIRKLGRLLRALEEQGGFLSKEERPPSSSDRDRTIQSISAQLSKPGPSKLPDPQATQGKLYALCEMVLEDLNNYRECMIPIDDSNTINLKLFPMHPAPAPVCSWHVPLLTINLSSFSIQAISSDLTLQRILPYIDGINSVSHISHLADTDLGLTRKAIQHLVYYSCVILLDVFQFGAIYAPTAEISQFVVSEALQQECARYVVIPRSNPAFEKTRESPIDDDSDDSSSENNGTTVSVSPENLVRLYTSLRQGTTLRNWCVDNLDRLVGIDIRRLITFGVIKGFLYRAHKYVVSTASGLSSPEKVDAALPQELEHAPPLGNKEDEIAAVAASRPASVMKEGRELPLEKYLDGVHSFDQICTELSMNEKDVLEKLKGFGEVQIIHR